LAALLGASLQSGVHVVGDVAYQHVRHACIMLSLGWWCKEPKLPDTTVTDLS
jgi:hypothetical protein